MSNASWVGVATPDRRAIYTDDKARGYDYDAAYWARGYGSDACGVGGAVENGDVSLARLIAANAATRYRWYIEDAARHFIENRR